jgi:hypothetical protein
MKWIKKLFGIKPNLRGALLTEFGLAASGEGRWIWRKQGSFNLDILKAYYPEMSISEAVFKHITRNKPESICIMAISPAWHIIARSGDSLEHFDSSMNNDEMREMTQLLKQDYNPRGHDMGCFVWDAAK